MKKNDFIQQTLIELMPRNPRGQIKPFWAMELAKDAALILEESGIQFDPEDGAGAVDVQGEAAVALLRAVLEFGIEKNGMAGPIYVINEETYAEIKAFLGVA